MLIKITKDIPLIGCIMFGIIDRGTNLLQIRPTTVCNLNCIFCSTASGAFSQCHKTNYEVELEHLLDWTKQVVDFKEGDIECNIDSSGEPLCYPKIAELVQGLKKMDGVRFVSMQSNGTLLTKEMITGLEKAGLDRLNLSIHSMDEKKAKELAGLDNYDLKKVLDAAELIAQTKIELFITPVWIPNINDDDMPKLIEFAKNIQARLGIQKYETYKYSRKAKKAKKLTYYKFYRQLDLWEKEYDIKLKLGPKDYNIYKKKRLPYVFEIGDKLQAKIVCKGWMQEQMIAVAKDRCITINDCNANVDDTVRLTITDNKNNLYIGMVK